VETEDERRARLEEVAEVSDDLLEGDDDGDGDGTALPPGIRSIEELAREAANSLGNLLSNSGAKGFNAYTFREILFLWFYFISSQR